MVAIFCISNEKEKLVIFYSSFKKTTTIAITIAIAIAITIRTTITTTNTQF